ncbi:unnamed protein product [Amoebophrya sp. A120]|nr:unnamed protein product [Amoebophrya sp. A120]|eukprot:GSA120T00002650001.1
MTRFTLICCAAFSASRMISVGAAQPHRHLFSANPAAVPSTWSTSAGSDSAAESEMRAWTDFYWPKPSAEPYYSVTIAPCSWIDRRLTSFSSKQDTSSSPGSTPKHRSKSPTTSAEEPQRRSWRTKSPKSGTTIAVPKSPTLCESGARCLPSSFVLPCTGAGFQLRITPLDEEVSKNDVEKKRDAFCRRNVAVANEQTDEDGVASSCQTACATSSSNYRAEWTTECEECELDSVKKILSDEEHCSDERQRVPAAAREGASAANCSSFPLNLPASSLATVQLEVPRPKPRDLLISSEREAIQFAQNRVQDRLLFQDFLQFYAFFLQTVQLSAWEAEQAALLKLRDGITHFPLWKTCYDRACRVEDDHRVMPSAAVPLYRSNSKQRVKGPGPPPRPVLALMSSFRSRDAERRADKWYQQSINCGTLCFADDEQETEDAKVGLGRVIKAKSVAKKNGARSTRSKTEPSFVLSPARSHQGLAGMISVIEDDSSTKSERTSGNNARLHRRTSAPSTSPRRDRDGEVFEFTRWLSELDSGGKKEAMQKARARTDLGLGLIATALDPPRTPTGEVVQIRPRKGDEQYVDDLAPPRQPWSAPTTPSTATAVSSCATTPLHFFCDAEAPSHTAPGPPARTSQFAVDHPQESSPVVPTSTPPGGFHQKHGVAAYRGGSERRSGGATPVVQDQYVDDIRYGSCSSTGAHDVPVPAGCRDAAGQDGISAHIRPTTPKSTVVDDLLKKYDVPRRPRSKCGGRTSGLETPTSDECDDNELTEICIGVGIGEGTSSALDHAEQKNSPSSEKSSSTQEMYYHQPQDDNMHRLPSFFPAPVTLVTIQQQSMQQEGMREVREDTEVKDVDGGPATSYNLYSGNVKGFRRLMAAQSILPSFDSPETGLHLD